MQVDRRSIWVLARAPAHWRYPNVGICLEVAFRTTGCHAWSVDRCLVGLKLRRACCLDTQGASTLGFGVTNQVPCAVRCTAVRCVIHRHTQPLLVNNMSHYSYSKTNHMHQCIKFIYFGMTLYMFRTVFPSIIRSSRVYIQQQAFVKKILLYSLDLMMMDGKTVRNMYSVIPKYNKFDTLVYLVDLL